MKSTSENNSIVFSTATSVLPSCFIYLGFNGKLENGPYHVYLSVIEKKELPEAYQKGIEFLLLFRNGLEKIVCYRQYELLYKKGNDKFLRSSKDLNIETLWK